MFRNKTAQHAKGRRRQASTRPERSERGWVVTIPATLLQLCAFTCAATSAWADSSGSLGAQIDEEGPKPSPRWKIEVKRQNTDRGTPGETSNTKFRFESYPGEVPLSMLRLDVPFPDDRTSFEGDPFNPRLGDIKLRAKAKAVDAGGLPLFIYSELTFPTANPKNLGQGKYQVMLGVETSVPLASLKIGSAQHQVEFGPLVEQVVSWAGDEDFKDINYTKLELALRDTWQNYSLKLTLKPVIDWEQDGLSGAVIELEGGMRFSQGWFTTLMVGHRAWGGGVPSTYGTRVELSIGRMF